MFKFSFKTFLGFNSKEDNMFKITETNGKFFIVNRHGFPATDTGGYTRRRDAVRGATRRGLSLAA